MERLKITLVKSRSGATKRQLANLNALGLRKVNSTVEHDASAIIKGMIERVNHLIKVEGVVAQ
ncbi:MAG: 50S ribosomal protein L30 [Rikenellaceae bacterium]